MITSIFTNRKTERKKKKRKEIIKKARDRKEGKEERAILIK